MTVDEVIQRLEELKAKQLCLGTTPVRWDSIERAWSVDIAVRERGGQKVVIVNA